MVGILDNTVLQIELFFLLCNNIGFLIIIFLHLRVLMFERLIYVCVYKIRSLDNALGMRVKSYF